MRLLSLATSLGLFALIICTMSAAQTANPNFVILICDNHGVYHSSVYSSPELKTPNMQALADGGIHLTNA